MLFVTVLGVPTAFQPQVALPLIIIFSSSTARTTAVKFLKSAKVYGVLDRVMFGSDQMVWPEAISSSINFLNAMDFLTDEEKQMILYKNAGKFLGIKE